LDQAERTYLTALRQQLHRLPDLSGAEEATAALVQTELEKTHPDHILTGVGGAGLIAIYDSGRPGPSLMFRSELDALPIREQSSHPYRSSRDGISHACGHDGHMTTQLGLARFLGLNRPPAGKVLLLFQPSEETGEGALRVLADPRFQVQTIDRSYAWHNLPGFETGSVHLREGVFAAASTGLKCRFKGRSSHAAYPGQGRTPAHAVAGLLHLAGSITRPDLTSPDYAIATVTYVRMGEVAFGITPGEAEVGITLRTADDRQLEALIAQVEAWLKQAGDTYGLNTSVEACEPFAAVVNAAPAVDKVRKAARMSGLKVTQRNEPFPWSEDIGQFSRYAPLTLFGIGAGRSCRHLHAPDYDFPDNLIPIVTQLLIHLLETEWNYAGET